MKTPAMSRLNMERKHTHKPNSSEGWTDKYPLNTFKGETKKELVNFISQLLAEEREELVEEIFCNCRGRSFKQTEKGYRGICHTCEKFIDDELLDSLKSSLPTERKK